MNYYSGVALRRREAIRRLLREHEVRSQRDLRRLLKAEGLDAAQPTLSRDIHELGLVKGAGGYRVPQGLTAPTSHGPEPSVAGRRLEKLQRTIRQYVVAVEPAGTLVVLRTPPADAQPVALAFDDAALEDVVGAIAGDDTIFLAARSEREARELARRLREMIRATGAPRPARFSSRRWPSPARRRA
ncbi:MAG: arginine repressor [Thermoanaerobaculia bacterium]